MGLKTSSLFVLKPRPEEFDNSNSVKTQLGVPFVRRFLTSFMRNLLYFFGLFGVVVRTPRFYCWKVSRIRLSTFCMQNDYHAIINLFSLKTIYLVSIDISSFNFHSIKLDPLSHTDNTPNNWPGMAAQIKIQTLKNLWFVWSYSMVEDCIWHICVSTKSFSTYSRLLLQMAWDHDSKGPVIATSYQLAKEHFFKIWNPWWIDIWQWSSICKQRV